MTDSELVHYAAADGRATITLDSQHNRNALSRQLVSELFAHLEAAEADPAVRVVVDAPEQELVRIGTVRGGISAFRVLRAVLPAFFEWHRSLLLPRR